MLVKVFKNGNSKAIRIPKSFLDEDVKLLEITKKDNKIILTPKSELPRHKWRSFLLHR